MTQIIWPQIFNSGSRTGCRKPFLDRLNRLIFAIGYLKYKSHPTTIPIALLRTQESMVRSGNDSALGWWPLTRGRFLVEGIEGTHWTIFEADHIAMLAPQIDRALRLTTEAKTWDCATSEDERNVDR